MKHSVLVVDDDAAMRHFLRRRLENCGLEVIEASDGSAGLSAYRRHQPDLVFADLLMPGTDGMEMLLELRQIDPLSRVVAISGGGRMDPDPSLQIAAKLGAVLTLRKPFQGDEIERAVSRLLDGGTH